LLRGAKPIAIKNAIAEALEYEISWTDQRIPLFLQKEEEHVAQPWRNCFPGCVMNYWE